MNSSRAQWQHKRRARRSVGKDNFVASGGERHPLQSLSRAIVKVRVKRNRGARLQNETGLSALAAGNTGILSDRAEQNATQGRFHVFLFICKSDCPPFSHML